jgi:hypothetical protein
VDARSGRAVHIEFMALAGTVRTDLVVPDSQADTRDKAARSSSGEMSGTMEKESIGREPWPVWSGSRFRVANIYSHRVGCGCHSTH